MKTLASIKVFSNLLPQKPLTAMSSLASSVMMAVLPDSSFVVSSCMSGSTQTSLRISVSSVVVMSHISLCLKVRNPPRKHESACSTVKLAPHAQMVGSFEVSNHIVVSVHPHRCPCAERTHVPREAWQSAN